MRLPSSKAGPFSITCKNIDMCTLYSPVHKAKHLNGAHGIK